MRKRQSGLERRGFRVSGAPWNGPQEPFEDAQAVVLRSTWGYYRALQAFRSWTEAMASSTRLFNPIGLVHWNLRKDYVGKLAAAGVRVPGTQIVACEVDAIEGVFRDTGWARAVPSTRIGTGMIARMTAHATIAVVAR